MAIKSVNHRSVEDLLSAEPIVQEDTKLEQPVPAWLHSDDEEMPPSALQEIYKDLPLEVTQICEGARRAMRNAFVEGLCKVRDALAPHANFTAWCKAAGINIRTAQTIVARADRAKRQAEADKQPDDTSMTYPTLATQPTTTVQKPAKVPVENRIGKILLTWPDEQYGVLVVRLEVIGDALGFAHDNSATVEFLVNTFYEDHRAEYEQEEATA